MDILLYVAVGLISAVLGWVGHVVWFSLYYRRFMVRTTRRFMVVNLDNIREAFYNPEDNEEDFIVTGGGE